MSQPPPPPTDADTGRQIRDIPYWLLGYVAVAANLAGWALLIYLVWTLPYWWPRLAGAQ